jgi:hypothetical protein
MAHGSMTTSTPNVFGGYNTYNTFRPGDGMTVSTPNVFGGYNTFRQ